jgi:hypothetical protein
MGYCGEEIGQLEIEFARVIVLRSAAWNPLSGHSRNERLWNAREGRRLRRANFLRACQ